MAAPPLSFPNHDPTPLQLKRLKEDMGSVAFAREFLNVVLDAGQQRQIETPSTCRGSIQLIIGAMFSGKSTELLRRIRRYSVAKRRRCMVIKYKKDTRYNTEDLATHDKLFWPAVPCEDLNNITIGDQYDVIGIDEGQFFPNIVEFAEELANQGKIVIVAALDSTFQRLPFGHICDLVAKAEQVTKLTAICFYCQEDASFSMRLTNETVMEVIGGADKYVAVCRSCYNTRVTLSSSIEAVGH